MLRSLSSVCSKRDVAPIIFRSILAGRMSTAWSDPRYRVFVVGKDIFRARAFLGEVPVTDS
jgi:hypothetical protein